MGPTVYILTAVTTGLCAILLLSRYAQIRHRLLLLSGLCFVGLAVSNVLVFLDLVILPATIDLYGYRLAAAIIGMAFLLYGLVWERR